MAKYYLVSGGFDPIHEGHISLIQAAQDRGDGVIVLVNSDDWLIRKKGQNFMDLNSRMAICRAIKGVIDVISFDDSDGSASDGIIKARQRYPDATLIFANGGDRTKENIPEFLACSTHSVELEFEIGGSNKANSSSWLLNNWSSQPQLTQKPWGFYEDLFVGKSYKLKRLVIKQDESISTQKHTHRGEFWFVQSGKCLFFDGEKEKIVSKGEYIIINKQQIHKATSLEGDLSIIELQFGDYISEGDIVRLEDKYNRE